MATTKATLLGHRSATSFSDLTLSGDLTVNGTTTTLDTAVQNVDKLEIGASSTDYGAKINQASTGNILQLQDGGTDVMVVEDGGNVGIGVSSSIANLLHVEKAGSTVATFRTSNNNSGGGIELVGKDSSGAIKPFYLQSNSSSELLFLQGTGATERMRIDSSGNVGIAGATSPEVELDLGSGQMVLDNTKFIYWADAGGTLRNAIRRDSNEMQYWSVPATGNGDGTHKFKVGSDGGTPIDALHIDSSGNVGIATSSAPSEKLEVVGKAKATKIIGRGEQESSSGFQSDTFCVEGVNTSNQSTMHGAVFASKHSSSFPLICGQHDTTFNIFKVRADGKLFASGLGQETGHTTLAVRSSDGMIVRNTSSRRYKSNIVDTTTDSTLITNIKVRDFTWTETGNNYVGLIAEEVNEHLPNAVVKATEDDEVVCESIDWSALTSLLIDYSQKLEQRITALENA